MIVYFLSGFRDDSSGFGAGGDAVGDRRFPRTARFCPVGDFGGVQ